MTTTSKRKVGYFGPQHGQLTLFATALAAAIFALAPLPAANAQHQYGIGNDGLIYAGSIPDHSTSLVYSTELPYRNGLARAESSAGSYTWNRPISLQQQIAAPTSAEGGSVMFVNAAWGQNNTITPPVFPLSIRSVPNNTRRAETSSSVEKISSSSLGQDFAMTAGLSGYAVRAESTNSIRMTVSGPVRPIPSPFAARSTGGTTGISTAPGTASVGRMFLRAVATGY